MEEPDNMIAEALQSMFTVHVMGAAAVRRGEWGEGETVSIGFQSFLPIPKSVSNKLNQLMFKQIK